MSHVRLSRLVAATVLALLFAPCAQAVVIRIDDVSSFTNLTGISSATTFTGLSGGSIGFLDNPTTIDNITYSSDSTVLAVIDPNFNPARFDYGTGEVLAPLTEGTGPLLLSPVGGAGAIGFDFGGVSFQNDDPLTFTFTVTDAEGNEFTFDKTGGTPTGDNGTGFAFIGFVSDSPIVSVLATPSDFSGVTSYDNVRSNTIGAEIVPEVNTLSLLTLGTLPIGILFARRRRAAR